MKILLLFCLLLVSTVIGKPLDSFDADDFLRQVRDGQPNFESWNSDSNVLTNSKNEEIVQNEVDQENKIQDLEIAVPEINASERIEDPVDQEYSEDVKNETDQQIDADQEENIPEDFSDQQSENQEDTDNLITDEVQQDDSAHDDDSHKLDDQMDSDSLESNQDIHNREQSNEYVDDHIDADGFDSDGNQDEGRTINDFILEDSSNIMESDENSKNQQDITDNEENVINEQSEDQQESGRLEGDEAHQDITEQEVQQEDIVEELLEESDDQADESDDIPEDSTADEESVLANSSDEGASDQENLDSLGNNVPPETIINQEEDVQNDQSDDDHLVDSNESDENDDSDVVDSNESDESDELRHQHSAEHHSAQNDENDDDLVHSNESDESNEARGQHSSEEHSSQNDSNQNGFRKPGGQRPSLDHFGNRPPTKELNHEYHGEYQVSKNEAMNVKLVNVNIKLHA